MNEPYQPPAVSSDMNTTVRDIEERQRILRDRVILLGKTLIEERDKTFSDIQDMKKSLLQLKEESQHIKELLSRITEQLSGLARKEELMMLQRQFDLFRKA